MFVRILVASVIFVWLLPAAEQQFAELGDVKLESGAVINNCKIGYRTYGTLNPAKSNVVLWPTWFGGTTADLDPMVGPGKWVDSSKYYVITVDAIGNGVSCSPSNSVAQKNDAFPRFTIGDMVDSQHRLLTEVLGIRRLRAVLGISMGGMQTFEWIVRYPDMMEKAVPIVGTTKQTSMDLLLWGAELGIIEQMHQCDCGRDEAMKNLGRVHTFALTTPDYRVRETPVKEYAEEIAKPVAEYTVRNDYDWASQLRAMMDHDISRRFSGSMEAAAKAVKADVLVVVARRDHMVNPHPATEFAALLVCPLLTLEGDCGHLSPGCEAELATGRIARFLDQ